MPATAARMKFTKVAIDRLKPPTANRIYVYDSERRGLAICVTATGAKSWYFYRKIHGKPERIRLGAWPELTVEQARTLADRHSGKIAEGENPADLKRERRQSPTLKEMFELFVDLPTRTKSKRPKSPKTVHDYRLQFNAYLADWHNRKLASITRVEIDRKHNELAKTSGIYQANRVLALLKVLFNTAIENRMARVNPAAGIRAFEEQSRERFLQANELPKFMAAVDEEPSQDIRDFIKLALFTGQRRSNVLAMRWADVKLDRGVWEIPKTKTGKHEVPIIPAAAEILGRRMAAKGESEYVFPGRHGRGHLKDPMGAWRRILTSAGIDDLRIHDLRRSLGSWQAITGASLSVVGKSLGHTRPETTAIYARLSADPVRGAMETAVSAMLEAAKPKQERTRKKGK